MKKLGIFVPIIGFGRKGFYNSQEIGLGKTFVKKGYDVSIVKCLAREGNEKNETQELAEHLKITYYYCGHIGAHAKVDTSILDSTWDGMIIFADNQMCIPKVKRWCKANNVKFLPYAGIVHSFGDNKLKQMVMNWIFDHGTCNVYRKNPIIVKNTFVQKNLQDKGVHDTTLAPVGLDYSVLHDCTNESVAQVRKKWGFETTDKIIIFVGILTVEKRPMDALKIIEKLHEKDQHYKLILVGKGYLKSDIVKYIKEHEMQTYVTYIEEIANSQIWQLYYCADVYINLWEQEIFGMAILEALYYNNFVVAVDAPGPNTILHFMQGCRLCGSIDEVVACVSAIDLEKKELLNQNRIELNEHFNWENVVIQFEKVLDRL